MALVLANRVRETCTSPGTGTVTLQGAVIGFQSFAVIGSGNTTYYTISDQSGSRWEVGIGTYTSSGTTLSRDVVLASSSGTSLVNFNSGIQDVYVVYPSEKSVYLDASGNVSALGTVTSATWNGTTMGVAYGGTGQTTYTNGQLLIGNSTGNTLTKATLTQGTGITITNGAGSISIANSAPDQTVVLSNGTGINITGTYPSFTITNTDPGSSQNIFKNVAVAGQNTIVADSNNDTLTVATGTGITLATSDTTDTLTITNSAPDQTVAISSGTGINVTGTYPNFTVANTDTGSAQNIFKSIAVSGQSTVVADSNNDTLTLVAGTNVTITTDASTDSVTINSTGGGGGATGGGTDKIFFENGQTVTTSYSIPSGSNAMSTGPITINSGVTVTVPSGSRWVVL